MPEPVVLRSIEDGSGARCVDILWADARFFRVECRRDPEDSHGWRHVSARSGAFATQEAAVDAARAVVGWMEKA